MSPIHLPLLVARSEGKNNPPWKWIEEKLLNKLRRQDENVFLNISQHVPLLPPLLPRTWLAVWLNDRKSRVRRASCRRRKRRLIRLPANPVAWDGATAGWMNMITHSATGLTPQLHLSRLSLLICLRAAACLHCFWLPPSRSAHVCATVALSPNNAGEPSELLCAPRSQLLTPAPAKCERNVDGWGGVGSALISTAWKENSEMEMETAATAH